MPVLNYLRDFAPKAQSAFVRRAYARELVGEVSFTFPMAMLQGGVVGIIATLLFEIGPLGLATILAAPMFANFTSTIWARLLHGRRKAHTLAAIQGALLLVVAAIALLPTRPSNAAILVALFVLARCLFSGVLNTRSVIWRANYPRHSRSRITGRLIIINTFLLALLPLIAGQLFDADKGQSPWLFRGVYLGAAVIGVGSVVAYLGLRVRRERKLRRDENEMTIGSADSPAPAARVSAIQILLTDHHFRAYMVWQFMAGVATMAGNTAMIAFVAEQIDRVPGDWSVGPFLIGFVLTDAIVQLFVALSIPFFAHYLDKVHVTRFRTRHGLLWILTQASNFVITYLAAINGAPLAWLLVLLIAPRIFQGLVFGGGRLAWQLGHNDFADRHLAATYMAIHQTLTGVRGFIAPFTGVLLYTGWEQYSNVLGTGITIPAWDGIGYWVFAITLAFAVIGWAGFVRLDKQVGGDGAAQAHD